MSQSDLTIQNQSFPSFRSDLNDALTALNSTQSGTSRPSSAVAGTIWLDTTNATNPTLKFYDGTDDISLATIDYSANTVNWLDSTVSITGLSTTATGTVLTLTDSNTTTTVDFQLDNEKKIKFFEADANGSNAVSLKAPSSLSADVDFVLPSADGTADQVLKTDGAGNLSFTDVSSGATNPFRNIIINGDMSIAQRSTSETGQTSSGYICVDRFRHGINNQGTWTISQSTDVPSGQGFAKSMKMDCTTADASPAADDYIWFEQKIEGFANLQHLKKGTANAESITVSFWVKATKTGTNVLEFLDKDNTRHICQTYTINSSNTWEKKTITFDPDTTGTFNFDNGESASLLFWIGAGSNYTSGALDTTWGTFSGRAAHRAGGQVNHADSTSNNFYLTGIQLEAGTTASDFEFLPYDVNLQRCQRYFNLGGADMNGTFRITTGAICATKHPVEMRTSPSVSLTGEATAYRPGNSNVTTSSGSISLASGTQRGGAYNINGFSGVSVGDACGITADVVEFSSEL